MRTSASIATAPTFNELIGDESWVRLRRAFSVLLGQYGNGAYLASGFIGGQSVTRDRKGGKGSRDPIVPTPGDKQREALKFVSDEILSDRAFKFSPALLRRITKEQWYHWGSDSMYGCLKRSTRAVSVQNNDIIIKPKPNSSAINCRLATMLVTSKRRDV
jgi:hypothetical protein